MLGVGGGKGSETILFFFFGTATRGFKEFKGDGILHMSDRSRSTADHIDHIDHLQKILHLSP